MRKRLRPSPSLAISVVALFVAIGGVAGALPGKNSVDSGDLKKNAVHASDVKNAAVTTKKLKNKAIKTAKLADGAVTSAKVAEGAIATADLAETIPAARVTRTTNQIIPNGPGTQIAFDSERYDTAGMHDTSANNSRLTAPVTGIYSITLEVDWLFNPSGLRNVEIDKNGTTAIATETVSPPPTTGDQEITTQARLQAGEFVVASVQQSSGGDLAIAKANEYSPEFSMTWLAPGPP